jgi:glutamyl-tRNA synthetase
MVVRTRFAPSPTGFLHIGGVRTALFNWLFARRHGGQFLLRIDDTDADRNTGEALDPILQGLRWLGLEWDEGPEKGGPCGPYFQSQRAARHREAVEKLLASGHAYRDYARPEELEAEREAARTAGSAFLYSRRFRADTPAQCAAFEAEGRRGVVRLAMPRVGACTFRDLVRGEVSFEWAREQDHVIARADGSCLYHLASAVDDHDMGITHVIRAEEHLANTPRQIFITGSLGWKPPDYAHLPFVAEPGSRNKLSKRKLARYLASPDFARLHEHGRAIARAIGAAVEDETFNPVIVGFYETVGYLPDALVNYLLLLGWSLDDRTEDFTREGMIRSFSLERVNRAPASFDAAKLLAFQERRWRALPLAERVARCVPFLQRAGLLASPLSGEEQVLVQRVVQAAGDRIKVAGDILGFQDLFVPDDRLEYDEAAFEKRLARRAGARERTDRLRERLAGVASFRASALEELVRDFVEEEGVPLGEVIHALRVAVTGKPVGFGMFDTLEILGRERTLSRIDRALARARTVREGA